MKNVTLSIPEDVYRAARIRAAERDTSVSALVSQCLRSLTEDQAELARLESEQRKVQAELGRFRARDRLGRDAVHDRAVH